MTQEEIKEHRRIYNKTYREKNRDKLVKRSREYYKNNADELNRKKKIYCKNNQEKISVIKKNYSLENIEKRNKYRKENHLILIAWKEKNRDKMRAYHSLYRRNKRISSVQFKLADRLRVRFNKIMRGKSRSEKFLEILGCNMDFLRDYLEIKFKDGMSWKNIGQWHIDHIKPICNFNLTLNDEIRKAFNYTNLQPLWAQENLSKGRK